MPRAPYQVLVFPYWFAPDGTLEYCLLKRADTGYWQGVAGGGEDNESPAEAAQRETFEETGIRENFSIFSLSVINAIPVTEFPDSRCWGDNRFVIPEYCFGIRVNEKTIRLSNEHTEFGWFVYPVAQDQLRYDGNKVALWELDRKARGLGPRD